MNLKNKVKELINISCLNEICNVLPYEDKDIYLIGGATRSILSDKYENKDIDLVIPDLDSFTVDKILDKYNDAKYYPVYKSISLVFNDFEYPSIISTLLAATITCNSSSILLFSFNSRGSIEIKFALNFFS